jgi:HK97 family phage prohead protease
MEPKSKTPTIENRQQLPLAVRAAVQPSSLDEEARTVEVVFSTGADVLRYDWGRRQYYYQRLRIDGDSINLSRLLSGAPVLDTHSAWKLSSVLGVVEAARVEAGQAFATLRFARDDEDVDRVWRKIADGILRNVSVGFSIERNEQLDEEKEGRAVREAAEWTPHEISVVPIPADPDAQVRGELPIPEEVMDENTNETQRSAPTEAPTSAPDVQRSANVELEAGPSAEQVAEAAVRRERERTTGIQDAVRKAGLDSDLAARLVREGVSLDGARTQIIDALAERNSEPTTQIAVGGSRPAEYARHAGEAILARFDGSKPEHEDARGIMHRTLQEIGEQVLSLHGVDTRMMPRQEIAKRAMATVDFSGIIAHVAGRSLRAGYDSEPKTYQPFMRKATASNFRNIERVALSDAPDLDLVAEGDPYTEGTLSDGKETYSVAKYGKILPFTWEAMINDDLDALTRVPMMMGSAAVRKELELAWGVMNTPPNLADGNPLFHASRSNTTTLVLDAAGLKTARQYFRTRTTEQSAPLYLPARYLIVGPELESEAELLIGEQQGLILADRADTVPQRLRNSLELIVEPRVTALNWFLACQPATIDTVEYAYLLGEEGPTLERDTTFNNDDLKFKIRHVFGVGAIDGRGLYHSDGTGL